jgi:SagB-type dehydrogenase family enzyme
MNRKQNINFYQTNKYVDLKVKKDILSFHNKGNILLDKPFFPAVSFPPLPLDVLQNLETLDTEINPFHHDSIPCTSIQKSAVRRNRSASDFTGQKIDFEILQTLLNESFAANEELRRPYPSGGALYTIEVLCCATNEKINQLPVNGIYHYRANLKKLQLLREVSYEKINQHVLSLEQEQGRKANFILIYVINLPKAIVKYRYRGYRLAWMEVGAMFMQADLVARELGLKNRLSSSFNDFEITKFAQLDAHTFIPAIVQLFGT